MKKYIYRILGVCMLLMASMQALQAQGPKGGATVTIAGDATASVGDSKTYTITTSLGVNILAANWTVTGGTIQLQSHTMAVIDWTTVGTHTIQYNVTASNYGSIQDLHIVTVGANTSPAAPPTPTIINASCNSAELVKTGIVPLGQQWYWQGYNAMGVSTANPATSNYIATTSGMHYIRAKNLSTNQWSTATGVQITLVTPTWYADADGDKLGDPNVSLVQCTQPLNYVSNATDQCPNEHGEGSVTGCIVPVALSSENYVYTVVPQKEITNLSQISANATALKNVLYLDGLGRPVQTIDIKQSASGKDIVKHTEYDPLGRQNKKYLPFASSSNTGAMQAGAATETKNYYKTAYAADFANIPAANINPYTEVELEASPLDRPLKQAAPGEAWRLGNGHEIEFDYGSNTANEVRFYRVDLSSNFLPTLTGGTSYYAASELIKTINRDENHTGGKNQTTEEFKDLKGQVVLKRTYAATSISNSEAHDTYYVYDDFGNLSYVLPPKSEASTAIPTNTTLNELCFQYIYDHKNRLVEKKVPGKGWEFIIYDNLDRVVLTQDANQVNSNQWLFIKHDKLGRLIYSGEYTHPSLLSRAGMQTHFNAQNNVPAKLYEAKVNTGTGEQDSYYTNSNFPSATIEVLTVNYYDNYSYNLEGSAPPNSLNYLYPASITSRVKGMLTGTKVKVLGTSEWISTITYYDQQARPVYVYRKNAYLNTIDVVQSKLDFAGKEEETSSLHTKTDNSQSAISIVDKFSYDHAARLITHTQQINNNPIEVIANNTYDELGQMQVKRVGGKETDENGLQTIDYSYNVRGWLKNINEDGKNDNDLFDFSLRYNDPTAGTALFNGNISQTSWHTANVDNSVKTYTYTYDALNRITAGDFNVNSYDLLNVAYDKNGNITGLTRNKPVSAGGNDGFTYSYNSGNQLTALSGSSNGSYSYDANGNMKTDGRKNITGIDYNHLNLPTQININGQSINYVYDAIGTKQSKTANGVTIQYAGNYVYEKPSMAAPILQFISHAEGYTIFENGQFPYVYQYKDNLGNVRLSYLDADNDGVISASTEIIEESNYYPFGLKHQGYNNAITSNGNSLAQNFKFNGKEIQQETGWLDFGARMYQPDIGRFFTQDRFSDKYRAISPYQYAANDPINLIDINGDSIWFDFHYNEDGTLSGVTMNVTGKVLNQSSDDIDMENAVSDISSAISKTFSGSFTVNGKSISFKTNIELTEATSMDDVSESDHLFVIADNDGSTASGAANRIGGKVAFLNSADFPNKGSLAGYFGWSKTRTAVHEFGHLAGLTHGSASWFYNLMRSGGLGTNLTSYQKSRVAYIGKYENNSINKGKNYTISPITGKKHPNPTLIDADGNTYHINQVGIHLRLDKLK